MLRGTRFRLCCAAFLAVAVVAFAQDKPKPKKRSSGKYANDELGLVFTGVYGWEHDLAGGSGAWTKLAEYRSDGSLDSTVQLLVRDNPYTTVADLRAAMEKQFKESEAEPTEDAAVFKEISFTDSDMKKGLKLPGIQVECFMVEINEEGKKRERKLIVRTYFGKNRLFRVRCEARRARAKRVQSYFDTALAGLVVTAADEEASRGAPFRSLRGRYACLVPEGFTIFALPDNHRPTDVKFENRKLGVSVSVVSYAYTSGHLIDHVEEMTDFYGERIKIDNEETKILGGMGFLATITKGKDVTLVAGTVQAERAYRIHTRCSEKNIDVGRRVHEAFMKDFKITKR